MKTNETGEFELVLGNKQVLSGFFIVVILFGVFFTMGYIVGRNSAPSPRMAAEQASSQPLPAQAGAQPPAAKPELQMPPPTEAKTANPGETATQRETQPVREPETKAATPASVPPAAPENAVTEPVAGQTYLQVMAVKRPEAEAVVRTLKDKGFPAVLATGPNDLIRVLVGPFNDAAATGKAKADLENAGFHPIVRK